MFGWRSVIICAAHSGIIQQTFGVQIAADSLQHETHDEIYGIDRYYDH